MREMRDNTYVGDFNELSCCGEQGIGTASKGTTGHKIEERELLQDKLWHPCHSGNNGCNRQFAFVKQRAMRVTFRNLCNAAGRYTMEAFANLKVYICVEYSGIESVITITAAGITPTRQLGGAPS